MPAQKLVAKFVVLLDMLYLKASQVETHAEVIGAKYGLQVGNMRELFGHQSTIERIESFDTVILEFDVSLHEVDIWSQVFKKGTRVWATKHRNSYIRILHSHIVDNGHHCLHVAKLRESNDKYMLFPHFL